MDPWNTIQVDMIGPWTLKRNTIQMEFKALTMIEPVTCWPELALTVTGTSAAISNIFDTQWLCRYPRPTNAIHDNGGEFTGIEFLEPLQSYGINSKPTTVKNPQANSIVERSHLVISNQLRTFDLQHESLSTTNFKQMENDLLQATAWAIRSTIHSTLQRTPGQLIFQRDMVL